VSRAGVVSARWPCTSTVRPSTGVRRLARISTASIAAHDANAHSSVSTGLGPVAALAAFGVLSFRRILAEQERAGHRRLYELSANYAATPEEFTRVLDDANNQRMQSAAKILSLRFRMKDLMTAEEWKALSDQMLAYSSRYKHSESAPKAGY